MARESIFERNLLIDLEDIFPGCVILKNDPNNLQGVLDRIILFENRWAMFEAKADENSPHQVNQDYYVDLFNHMSYASFVFPQNRDKVLDELQQALRPRRTARFSRRF